MKNCVVFFDLETTGVDPAKDEIIQIAALAVGADSFAPVDSFEAKIHPSVTGRAQLATLQTEGFPTVYDKHVWARDAVPLREAINGFADWVRVFPAVRNVAKKSGRVFWTAQLIGHNAAKFDGPFLFRVAQELGIFMPASYHVLDTLQLAAWVKIIRGLNTNSFTLIDLARHFDVELLEAHNAIDDIKATVEVAKNLIRLMS